MSQGLLMTAIGAAVGLAAALGSKQVIGSFLFGLEPTDPAMLGAVMATLAIVTAFACWLPAWRASRLDPNLVLRTE